LFFSDVRVGRVDVFVQSTDKNLMVPVGGSIVAGYSEALLGAMQKNYPGEYFADHDHWLVHSMLSQFIGDFVGN
jgi:O-phospho-L-seryl-tRNASec:L-selenocysteinyl-tRNA synthase